MLAAEVAKAKLANESSVRPERHMRGMKRKQNKEIDLEKEDRVTTREMQSRLSLTS